MFFRLAHRGLRDMRVLLLRISFKKKRHHVRELTINIRIDFDCIGKETSLERIK